MTRRQLMRGICLAGGCAALWAAADPGWKTKPIAQWTDQDAKQVLTASPWAKDVNASIGRKPSEDELRDGGRMGQPQGVGYQGIDPEHMPVNLPDNLYSGGRAAPRRAPRLILKVRWESALPVRFAELKLPEIGLGDLDDSEGYRIAVWNVPGGFFEGDPKKIGDPLKEEAWLKREGKKDVRPAKVEVFSRPEGAVVVYLFPLSAEITPKDNWVTFEAHMGRIAVSHAFNVAEMQFQGKLAL
jgi:hypothetical protein